MKILFCSPVPVDPRLGMVKHALELAESLRTLGWETHAVGPEEIAGCSLHANPENFPTVLRDYLRRVAGAYDVVEYDHAYLPFPRQEFPSSTLFVARCMLLHHHFLTTPIPSAPGPSARLGHLLTSRRRADRLRRIVTQTDATVRHADLTVVSNDRDAAVLTRSGADPGRIEVLPLGLSRDRLGKLGAVSEAPPADPVVGFIGTFDPRKGMREFPELLDRVTRRVPGARFRLLGTAGLVSDADGVRRHFPRRLWPRLEIHSRYNPADLPALLSGVSVGVFPSRVESFGYGVLEMLAAAIPVVAYDAPGPHVMIPPELRVPIGAVGELAAKAIGLLIDPSRLDDARRRARERAQDFCWDEIALRTSATYLDRIRGANGGSL